MIRVRSPARPILLLLPDRLLPSEAFFWTLLCIFDRSNACSIFPEFLRSLKRLGSSPPKQCGERAVSPFLSVGIFVLPFLCLEDFVFGPSCHPMLTQALSLTSPRIPYFSNSLRWRCRSEKTLTPRTPSSESALAFLPTAVPSFQVRIGRIPS